MGIIMRNGIPYGGTDNDFIVVDSLNSVSNPKTECLYCVNNQLYFYENDEWKRIGGGSGEDKEIDANEGEILIGDGNNWTKKSFLTTTSKNSLPIDTVNSYIFQTGLNSLFLPDQNMPVFSVFSGGAIDDSNGLVKPFLALNGDTECFLRGKTSIDIGNRYSTPQMPGPTIRIHNGALVEIDNDFIYNGSTVIGQNKYPIMRIHGWPTIEIDNGKNCSLDDKGPDIKIHGAPKMYIEDASFIKMDDAAVLDMEQYSYFKMCGWKSTATSETTQTVPSPSPFFCMEGACGILLRNSGFFSDHTENDGNLGPGLVMDPQQITFGGQIVNPVEPYVTQQSFLNGNQISLDINYPSNLSYFNQVPVSPLLSLNHHSCIDANSNGEFYMKGGGATASSTYLLFDPDERGKLFFKVAPKSDGKTTYIIEGLNNFYKFDDYAHYEQLNGSFFIMKKQLENNVTTNKFHLFEELEDNYFYTDVNDFCNRVINGTRNEDYAKRMIETDENAVFNPPLLKDITNVINIFKTYGICKIKISDVDIKEYIFDYSSTKTYSNSSQLLSDTDVQNLIKEKLGDNAVVNIRNFKKYKTENEVNYYRGYVSYTNCEIYFKIPAYESNFYNDNPTIGTEKNYDMDYNNLLEYNKTNKRIIDDFPLPVYSQYRGYTLGNSPRIVSYIIEEESLLQPYVFYTTNQYSCHLQELGLDYSKKIDANNCIPPQAYANDRITPMSGPIFQMYNNSLICMGGYQLTDRMPAARIPNNPLLEIVDAAEISHSGDTKIKTYFDENNDNKWTIEIGIHGVDGDSNSSDDTIKFTLEELKALKQLLI